MLMRLGQDAAGEVPSKLRASLRCAQDDTLFFVALMWVGVESKPAPDEERRLPQSSLRAAEYTETS